VNRVSWSATLERRAGRVVRAATALGALVNRAIVSANSFFGFRSKLTPKRCGSSWATGQNQYKLSEKVFNLYLFAMKI
jgi:hypothetical protein